MSQIEDVSCAAPQHTSSSNQSSQIKNSTHNSIHNSNQLSLEDILNEVNESLSESNSDSQTSQSSQNSQNETKKIESVSLEEINNLSIKLPKEFKERRNEINDKIIEMEKQIEDFVNNFYNDEKSEFYHDDNTLDLLINSCNDEIQFWNHKYEELSKEILLYETKWKNVYESWFYEKLNNYKEQKEKYQTEERAINDKYIGSIFPPVEQIRELEHLRAQYARYIIECDESLVTESLKEHLNKVKKEMDNYEDELFETIIAKQNLVKNKLNQWNPFVLKKNEF